MLPYTHIGRDIQWAFNRACYWRLQYQASNPEVGPGGFKHTTVALEAKAWNMLLTDNEVSDILRKVEVI